MMGSKQRKKAQQNATRLVQLAEERQREEDAATRKRQASRALSRSPSPRPADAAPPAAAAEGPPPGLGPSPPADARAPPPPRPAPAQDPVQAALLAQIATLGQQLAAIETRLSGQLSQVQASLAATEQRAKAAEDRAAALETKVEALSSALARADQRQEGLDRAYRKDKMMFFGLAEASGESVEEQVKQHLRAVECPAVGKITEVVRLGRAREPGPGAAAPRPRPVRVTFASPTACFDVFKSCKALREQRKLYVDRDLTPQQMAVRASLQGEYKELREGGRRPFWRGEKLFVPGEGGGRPSEIRAGEQRPAQPNRAAGAAGAREPGAPSPQAGEQRASPSAWGVAGPSA